MDSPPETNHNHAETGDNAPSKDETPTDYHSNKASLPPSHAMEAMEPSTTATTLSPKPNKMHETDDEKARYRQAGATVPGAVAMTTTSTPVKSSSPDGAATTPSKTPTEKAGYLSTPTSKPGAVAVGTTPSSSTTPTKPNDDDMLDPPAPTTLPVSTLSATEPPRPAMAASAASTNKDAYRSTAAATVPGAQAVSNSTPPTPSKKDDSSAKQQQPQAPLSSTTSATAVDAQTAVIVQSVESDLLDDKKKHGRNSGTTRPGAVAAGGVAVAAGAATVAMSGDTQSAVLQLKEDAATAKVAAAAAEGGANPPPPQVTAASLDAETRDALVQLKMASDGGPSEKSMEEKKVLVMTEKQPSLDPPAKEKAPADPEEPVHTKTFLEVNRSVQDEELASRQWEKDMSSRFTVESIPAAEMSSSTLLSNTNKDRESQRDMSSRFTVESIPAAEMSSSTLLSNTKKDRESQRDLAVAIAIDEDAEKEKLAHAEDFQARKRRALYQRPWFLFVLACIVSVCVAAIVTGVVVANNNNNNDTDDDLDSTDDQLANSPTASPSMAPTTSDQVVLYDWLLTEKNLSMTKINSAKTAFDLALDWYANQDPGRNMSIPVEEFEWDYNRFLMAWLYFALSSNGTKPWVSCNPPNYDAGQTNECIFLEFKEVASNLEWITYNQVAGKRWLSNFSLCEWAGLECIPDQPPSSPFFTCNGAPFRILLRGFGLSGPLPEFINELVCLIDLVVSYNSDLTGSVPSTMFDFPPDSVTKARMNSVSIFNNTGMEGPIPDALWALTRLTSIILGDNGFTGTFPDLSGASTLPALRELLIYGNNFGGPLPVLGAEQGALRDLRLQRSGFTGTIPSTYGDLANLRELWLFENFLNGTIPETFAELSRLRELRLQKNDLTGNLPALEWTRIRDFEVSSNKLNGSLPLGIAGMTRLERLLVDENDFTGEVPDNFFANLTSLEQVRLRDNMFRGPIPSSLSGLENMVVLQLNENAFTGDVPFEICLLRGQLTNLQADCLGVPPQNECFCCTACCSNGEDYRTCQTIEE